MRIATDLPRDIRTLRHVRIPMRDGTRLAATIWLPQDAEDDPVPALLELLPYRRSDWTAARDAQRHPWYAGHGYASVRVDLRGCGDSEGVLTDEYTAVELADALEVIAWLAAQPWCTGSVGMFGISWGGFNSLQVAALAPPALRAIVTVCSTDDRYADDVHYYGGALLGIDMSAWAGTMFAYQARPPLPWVVGEGWQQLWDQRLAALAPWSETWLSHQERDDYWRHGSVCEDYDAITAPVLAVGGWADPYRNTVLRLVEHLSVPCRGIIGPWSHQYPDIDRTPGPNIGFLQETLRWWDHWLKGDDTGVLAEPALRVYQQESVRPATSYAVRPGRWVGLGSWPSDQVRTVELTLGEDLGTLAADEAGHLLVDTPAHLGVDAGRWFPFGNAADLPPDQRGEDGRSQVLQTPPLTQALRILGVPRLRLRVRPEAPSAVLITRLTDVAPDGSSTLITRGALNLARRDGMERADLLVPGEWVDVQVELTAISWTLPPGHRLRLALSTTYWPWVWPLPDAGAVTIDLGASALSVPVLAAEALAGPEPVFAEPEQAPPLLLRPAPGLGESVPEREVRYLPETDTWVLTVDPRYGEARVLPDGLVLREQALERYEITGNDPLSAVATTDWVIEMARGDWSVRLATWTRISATTSDFILESGIQAHLGDAEHHHQTRRRVIPRTSI